MSETIAQQIEELNPNTTAEIKIGLTTHYIEKINENRVRIDRTNDGWVTTWFDIKEIKGLDDKQLILFLHKQNWI